MNRYQITDVIDACEKIETICNEKYQCVCCPLCGTNVCEGELLEVIQRVLNNFYDKRVKHD